MEKTKVRILIPLTVARMPAGAIGEIVRPIACLTNDVWEIEYRDNNNKFQFIVLSERFFEKFFEALDFQI